MATKKPIVNVNTEENKKTSAEDVDTSNFKITPESKSKAGKFRLIAIVAWVLAIASEGVAIYFLGKPPVNTTVLIALIVVAMILAIAGSQFWQKANRLDPASKKDKARFFIQNQLGLIITIIAFAPLIFLIFTNKNMDKKQKSLVGIVAIVALLIAGYFGIDFNPSSIEEYQQQTQEIVELTGQNHVYWTTSGTKYHVFSDCYHINQEKTVQIFEGTVAQARELKSIVELCKTCTDRWHNEHANDTDTTTDDTVSE